MRDVEYLISVIIYAVMLPSAVAQADASVTKQ